MLDRQIELFRIRKFEVRVNGEHRAIGFIRIREVGRLKR